MTSGFFRARGRTRFLIVLIGGAAAFVLLAWGVVRFFRPTVTVTRAVQGPVVQAFYATGTVAPQREFPVRSATAGILTTVNVDKGVPVKKGQPLAVVSDPVLDYALNKAKAELAEKTRRADEKQSPVLAEYDARIAAAKQQVAIAGREEKRLTDLLARSAASSVDVDQAADRVQVTAAAYESLVAQRSGMLLELERDRAVAQAAVDTAAWFIEQQTLRAPVDGVVLDRPTSQGTRVAVNDTVMRVADVRPANLVMRAAVDEEDLVGARVGGVVRMSLYALPGETISGVVSEIYPEADRERRTFEIDVKFDQQDDRLRTGMTGELAFVVAEKARATVVPSQAAQNGTIYVVRGGRLVDSDAAIGIKSVERVEVTGGLRDDDRVVISPIGTIAPGQAVRVTEADPRAAAAMNKPADAEGGGFKGFN